MSVSPKTAAVGQTPVVRTSLGSPKSRNHPELKSLLKKSREPVIASDRRERGNLVSGTKLMANNEIAASLPLLAMTRNRRFGQKLRFFNKPLNSGQAGFRPTSLCQAVLTEWSTMWDGQQKSPAIARLTFSQHVVRVYLNSALILPQVESLTSSDCSTLKVILI